MTTVACTHAVGLAVMRVLDAQEVVKILAIMHVIQRVKVVVKDPAKGDASILVQLVVVAVLIINSHLPNENYH